MLGWGQWCNEGTKRTQYFGCSSSLNICLTTIFYYIHCFAELVLVALLTLYCPSLFGSFLLILPLSSQDCNFMPLAANILFLLLDPFSNFFLVLSDHFCGVTFTITTASCRHLFFFFNYFKHTLSFQLTHFCFPFICVVNVNAPILQKLMTLLTGCRVPPLLVLNL